MDDYGSKETILRESKVRVKYFLKIKSLIITTKANASPTKIII